MKLSWRLAAAAALFACVLLPAGGLAGCRGEPDGLTTEQRKSGDRLGEIAKRTGGDWEKLTPEERDFLVKDLSYGNEQSARMLLAGASRQGPVGTAGKRGQ